MIQYHSGKTFSLCLILFLTPALFAGDWTGFRGPDGSGISDEKGLPVSWSETENIAWKRPMPGYGASSPIALKGRIYATCYSGYGIEKDQSNINDLMLHLVCIDTENGWFIWNKSIKPLLPESTRVRDHGYAASTPVTDGSHLYVFFGKTGLFKFDLNGNQLWQKSVGTNLNGWGSGASPVLYKNLVIVNASVESESIVALDKQTGDIKWQAQDIKESWNTPVIVTAKSGREELIVAIHGKILAFDPDTGDSLWSCNTDITWYMAPSIVEADGVVYCLGGRSGITALAVRTGGTGDVTTTHRLWTSDRGSNVSSPVFQDGYLYWAHEQRGTVFCAKARTGEIVYEQRLNRAGQIYASVLLADGRLYYLTRNGETFVIAAKPQFEQLAHNTLADRSTFNASPITHDGMIILRSDKNIYAFKKMN